MQCPYCSDEDTKTRVVETRGVPGTGHISRRRKCPHCERHFTTVERLDAAETAETFYVKGPDGNLGPLSIDRIRDSIRSVMAKASGVVPDEVLEAIVARVGERVIDRGGNSGVVTSTDIEQIILKELTRSREIYATSRIRYALGLRSQATTEGGFNTVSQLKDWLVKNWPYGEPKPLSSETRPERLVRKKPPGATQPWNHQTLERSVRRAAKGRPGDEPQRLATACVQFVLERLDGQSIVTTDQISAEAMNFLRGEDPLTYLRYASATKRYRTAREFLIEIEDLERALDD